MLSCAAMKRGQSIMKLLIAIALLPLTFGMIGGTIISGVAMVTGDR